MLVATDGMGRTVGSSPRSFIATVSSLTWISGVLGGAETCELPRGMCDTRRNTRGMDRP